MEENPPPTENLSQTVSLVGHMQYANVVAIAAATTSAWHWSVMVRRRAAHSS